MVKIGILVLLIFALFSCAKQTPIQYFGLVVDSMNVPVPDAKMTLVCNKKYGAFSMDPEVSDNHITGPDGSFRLSTRLRKHETPLYISIRKDLQTKYIYSLPKQELKHLLIVFP